MNPQEPNPRTTDEAANLSPEAIEALKRAATPGAPVIVLSPDQVPTTADELGAKQLNRDGQLVEPVLGKRPRPLTPAEKIARKVRMNIAQSAAYGGSRERRKQGARRDLIREARHTVSLAAKALEQSRREEKNS